MSLQQCFDFHGHKMMCLLSFGRAPGQTTNMISTVAATQPSLTLPAAELSPTVPQQLLLDTSMMLRLSVRTRGFLFFLLPQHPCALCLLEMRNRTHPGHLQKRVGCMQRLSSASKCVAHILMQMQTAYSSVLISTAGAAVLLTPSAALLPATCNESVGSFAPGQNLS